MDPKQAHSHSIYHREEVLRSETCGCFYCRRTARPEAITQWVDKVDRVFQTALCPK